MDAGSNAQPKRKLEDLSSEDFTLIKKQPRAIPSILKGGSVPRKPRIGEGYQATLPEPTQAPPNPKHRAPTWGPSKIQKPINPATNNPSAEQ